MAVVYVTLNLSVGPTLAHLWQFLTVGPPEIPPVVQRCPTNVISTRWATGGPLSEITTGGTKYNVGPPVQCYLGCTTGANRYILQGVQDE